MVEPRAQQSDAPRRSLAILFRIFFAVTSAALAWSVVQPELAAFEQVAKACAVPEHKRNPEQARICSPSPASPGFIIPGLL